MYTALSNSIFPRKITIIDGPGKFRNATGSALYTQAQRNLDKAQEDLITLQSDQAAGLTNLSLLTSKYGGFYNQINDGNYNDAIIALVSSEKYGNPDSVIWGKVPGVGDLRSVIPSKINPIEWYGDGRNTIFNMGVAGNDPWNAAQRDLVKHWAANRYAPEYNKLKSILEASVTGINAKIAAKQSEISRLTSERDRQLAAEDQASKQRIQENLTNPAYIKAKQEYDLALNESNNKAKSNKYILIGGAFVVLVIGGVFIFGGKSKGSKKIIINPVK